MSTQPTTQDQIDNDAAAAETTTDANSEPTQDPTGSAEQADSGVPAETADAETTDTETTDVPEPGDEVAEQDDADALSGTDTGTSKDATADADAGVASEDASESTDLTSGRSRSRRKADLEHEGEVAADFLESLMDIADLDGDLEVNVEGDRAAVSIVDSEDGPAPKRLVGHDGEVLEALQELTRLAVQAETGDRSRLMLDVAGHRAGRRAELVELARTKSAEVKESGERVELQPMSAFERKVVHDEVLASGLASESEGVEPNRYVVILPSA